MNNYLYYSLIFTVTFSMFFIGEFTIVSYAESDQKNSHQKILEILCTQKLDAKIFDPSCSKMNISNKIMKITHNSDGVGLVLSSTCEKLISVNSTDCPSYDVLDRIYPDVIIDPESNMKNKLKIITISHIVPPYKIGNSLKTVYNNQTSSFDYNFKDKRFVDEKCQNSIVKSDLFVIGDTIRFLKNNCDDKYTYLNNDVNFTKSASSIDVNDFSHHHYNIWLNDIIKNCVYEYGKCN